MQVLGGVSEEQAAETAASQAADEGEKKEIDQAIVQGTEESDDDADAADAKDGLDEGEDQKVCAWLYIRLTGFGV